MGTYIAHKFFKKVIMYRPVWTCGRYNATYRVALYYNLISGISYYFEDFSAQVIGKVLEAEKNGSFEMDKISEELNISMDSLRPFFCQLEQLGLVSSIFPSEDIIADYRRRQSEYNCKQTQEIEKTVQEKLPYATTSAEQSYFAAVDDGCTICSCMFELTYRCSEMCIHCYNPGATRNNTEVSHRADLTELTLENYKDIVDDMYNHGLVKVCLSGGDPFSKGLTWEFLDYLYNKGIAVDIYTNGQRIVNDVKRLASYFPRLVGVSIYSGKAEDHDAITRIPGSWEKSIKVVKALSEYAVPMNLKCCIMQPNLHTYYMVADLAKKYGAVPQYEINISESNDGDICAKLLRLAEDQLKVVLRDDNLALYVGPEALNFGGQKRDLSLCSCGAGGTGFCMSPNGDLRGCTAFTQVYGNLTKQSVEEILTGSAVLKEWRSAIVADFTECGKHDYCDYCNLCAGLNYSEHGDFRKPAESNCYTAKCRFYLAHELMKECVPLTREQLIQKLQALPLEKVRLQRHYRNKG